MVAACTGTLTHANAAANPKVRVHRDKNMTHPLVEELKRALNNAPTL
jgi:hypothetical protein